MPFSEPVANRGSDFFELPGEKMIGAFNDYEPPGLAHCFENGFDILAGSEFVAPALHNQFWFRARVQEGKIGVIHGEPEANQLCHARIRASNAQSHH